MHEVSFTTGLALKIPFVFSQVSGAQLGMIEKVCVCGGKGEGGMDEASISYT